MALVCFKPSTIKQSQLNKLLQQFYGKFYQLGNESKMKLSAPSWFIKSYIKSPVIYKNL